MKWLFDWEVRTVTLPYIGPLVVVCMKRKVKAGRNTRVVITLMYHFSSFRKSSASYLKNTIRKTLTAMASVQSTSARGNL